MYKHIYWLKKSCITLLFSAFILFLLANQSIFASDISSLIHTVEYSEDFQKWLELSDEDKQNVIQPRMYDVLYTSTNSTSLPYKLRLLRASNTSRYSLKDEIPDNIKIRNQQNTGSCWAFAALSSLETNLALYDYKKGISPIIYDFSERHMEYATSKTFADGINFSGYNREVGSGGNWGIAESYLTNGSGAIDELEMPFENNTNSISISEIQGKTVTTQVYDTVDFADYSKLSNAEAEEVKNQIKQHITNYGSVSAGIHGNSFSSDNSSCYNNSTGAKFCNDCDTHLSNHNVSIIGWDDNYSVDNFSSDSKPSSNGAWIVRNSWGEKIEYNLQELKEEIFNNYQAYCINNGWNSASEIPDSYITQSGYTINGNTATINVGDNGLIYVSYEDCNISKFLCGIVKATNYTNYENIYQYDQYSHNYVINAEIQKIMLCNIFNKQTSGTEYLTQVSLYAPETYTCKVYVNPNGTSTSKNDMQLISLKAGDSETFDAGYHTLEFATPLKINSSSFAVIVEIQSSRSGKISVALEANSSGIPAYDMVTIEQGKCLYTFENDLDNCEWNDFATLSQVNSAFPDGDSTIKAFTTSNLSDRSLSNITITTPPNKTSYIEGDNFDKTGMVVQANFSDGTYNVLEDSDYAITDGTNLKADQTSVTITYENTSVTQSISVTKNTVVELKITTPPLKTTYVEGENFDKTGMVIEATYLNGDIGIISDYTIIDGNNLNINQTTVTISYEGKSVNQTILVTANSSDGEKSVSSISIYKKPSKLTYIQNTEDIDLTDGILNVTYSDGTTGIISMTASGVTVTGFSNKTLGKITITICYQSKTTQLEVEIVDNTPEGEQVKNSNLDNAECSVTSLKLVFIDDDYTLIEVEVSNIARILTNDSVEYYYYLSSNASEENISNWIKITEVQTSNDKLQFTIDSRNVSNYAELASEDVIYLYIKEVAQKGEKQSVAISKSMKLETNTNTVINLDIKDYDSPSDSSDVDTPDVDKTVAPGKLPQTGVKMAAIIILTLLILCFVIFIYIKYKKIDKYTK